MASRDGKDSNTDDLTLFRREVDGASPIKSRKRHEAPPTRPPARATQRRRDERTLMQETLAPDADHDIETGDELRFRRDGVAPTVFRKLRQGKYSAQESLDLHGLNRTEAHAELRDFIAFSIRKGFRCVRVVHGKGLGSARGPVLKKAVNTWLRNWDEVVAFSSAPPRDGGTGAVYVLLRRR